MTPRARPAPFPGGVLIVRASSGRGAERFARALRAAGLAVARIDAARGREARRRVSSAVGRLAARCGGADARIAVIAERGAADAAVLGAAEDGRVRALALVSGRLARDAKELLADWTDAPALCVASARDRPALRDMADVFLASPHPDTDIEVLEGAGTGFAMGGIALEAAMARWVERMLRAAAPPREVSFTSEDGWRLYGNVVLPEAEGAPGVVLLHSGRTDRHVLGGLERLLARAGLAVLNIDWRGRGKSTNRGTYLEISAEERAAGGRDAKAAVDFLAAQPRVDPGRIGLVGVVHGAEYAVRGSIGDPRVRALVLLTGYRPADEAERAHLVSGGVHVFYVSSEGHGPVADAMRALYRETPDKLARLAVYRGGAIGYQLLKIDPTLGPAIVAWLAEALEATPP